MSSDADPRVYFAAERTLLAWIRTGLAVIGLGFVVSRFGLFLTMLSGSTGHRPSTLGSTIIGVGLMLLGSFAIGMSAGQHIRFCRTLAPPDRPPPYRVPWSVAFAALLSLAGVVLAGYLLLRSHPSDL